LKRRINAEERSFTPLSRLFAVAMTLKPRRAWISIPSSGTGSVFSESIVMSVSCTSLGMRVSSSTRASFPSRMAWNIGLGTRARSDGPSARSRA
jgi:hypothetical protein